MTSSHLLGRPRLLAALTAAVRRAKADRTLIACQRGAQTTLRFADGRFHQTFYAESVDVWVKAACDGHVGVATTNALSPEALRAAVEAAMAMARVAPHAVLRTAKDAGSSSGRRTLAAVPAAPPTCAVPPLATYVAETARRPIADTIQALHDLWQRTGLAPRVSRGETNPAGLAGCALAPQVALCATKRAGLAGSFTAGEEELAVAGSDGLARHQPFTVAGVKLVATRGKASGYAAATSRDIAALDLDATADRAVRLAKANAAPRNLRLGRYDVILEPEAVAELLEWLGYIAFGAKALAERTSPLAGRLGDQLMSPAVSIHDDALHPKGLSVPFDYEGVPKQRVALIERGVAAGVVYDTAYGGRYHQPSTGHGMPYDETEGPLPMHLTMAAGTTPRAELERRLGNGLVISRFHYVNGLLDTRRALMTGLTRDGTFLVRRGKVAGAVKNLRFTQSVLEAFSRVAALSRERRLIADPGSGLGAVLAPAMLIRGFTFTGATQ